MKLELNTVVDLSNPLKKSSKTQKIHALQSKRAIRTGPPLENDSLQKLMCQKFKLSILAHGKI